MANVTWGSRRTVKNAAVAWACAIVLLVCLGIIWGVLNQVLGTYIIPIGVSVGGDANAGTTITWVFNTFVVFMALGIILAAVLASA